MTTVATMPEVLPTSAPGGRPESVSRRLTGASALIRFLSRWSFFVENEVSRLDRFVEPGGVCVDAGASYGSYSYPLARRVGATGSVHSIEPMPRSARLMKTFVRTLRGHNIMVHQAALSDRVGTAEMSMPYRYGLVAVNTRSYLATGAKHQGANSEFKSARLVKTVLTTIDEIRREQGLDRVDLIKADVEGNEIALLEGALETIAAHRPTIMMEIEERHIEKYGFYASDVRDWLHPYGYAMYVWRSRAWRRVTEITTAERNYLFVHPDRLAAMARSR